MNSASDRQYLDLLPDVEARLIDGATDASPVKGLTHDHYKYPARFSPAFARSAIAALTKEGDLCLDPHVGGGTTLVEAMALGRDAVGTDISSLAEFVSQVKTTILSNDDLAAVERWSTRVISRINMRMSARSSATYLALGYYKHLGKRRWRLRKAIDQALASATALRSPDARQFGRCAVLRTAQVLLDGRVGVETVERFRETLRNTIGAMLEGARELSGTVGQMQRVPEVTVLHRNAAGMERDPLIGGMRAPALVLTSPPYPGVHILYHRWQVSGGKETPLPFMIAGKLDGSGGAYYTMGDRKSPNLDVYFESIRATMASVVSLADSQTTFVQMLAFGDSTWQLPRYLDVMESIGLREHFLPTLRDKDDGRLWRSVPNRRWYSSKRGVTPASSEVVLFHRTRVDEAPPLVASPPMEDAARPN